MRERIPKFELLHDEIVQMIKDGKTKQDIIRRHGGNHRMLVQFLERHKLRPKDGRQPQKSARLLDPNRPGYLKDGRKCCSYHGCTDPVKPGNHFLCKTHEHYDNVDLPHIDNRISIGAL